MLNFMVVIGIFSVATTQAAYAGICGRNPDALSFFLPHSGASGLAPEALREWAFVLDPEIRTAMGKNRAGRSPVDPDTFLATLNSSVWYDSASHSRGRSSVPHSLQLRLVDQPTDGVGRLDFAVIVRMDSIPLFDSVYTVELWGVGCHDVLWHQRSTLFQANASTMPAALASVPLSRPLLKDPSLAPTWVELSAGIELRWLSDCAAWTNGLDVFPYRPTDLGCDYGPAVAFLAWTVRGRVTFPSVAVPWLPALIIDVPATGVHIATTDLAAGSADLELFSACKDTQGLVNYSWRGVPGWKRGNVATCH
jgi:hypothetical protein